LAFISHIELVPHNQRCSHNSLFLQHNSTHIQHDREGEVDHSTQCVRVRLLAVRLPLPLVSQKAQLREVPTTTEGLDMQPSVVMHLITIHFGHDCRPLPLPKSLLQKLRQKVVDFGSGLYRCAQKMAVLESAGCPLPSDSISRTV
jgi:hypothetical protein